MVTVKIVVLDGYRLNPGDLSWDAIAAFGELKVYDRTPADLIVSRIGDAQMVYTNKTPITAATLDACPSVRFISVLATGYNIVDTAAAKQKGIPVCNVPTYGTASVAQMVFAHLLEICHHVAAHSQAVFDGAWTAGPDFCFWNYPLIELAGKTMGVVGFGRIGAQVGRIAKAFGMNVLAYDAQVNPALAAEGFTYVSLEELLRTADVVTLHCPLFPATQGMINRQTLALMKPTAILINTSRGPLVMEADLADALNAGGIAAAGVDVVSTEPIAADNPLLKARNLFITPHIAWAPTEARARLMQVSADNLKAFLADKPINVVNP